MQRKHLLNRILAASLASLMIITSTPLTEAKVYAIEEECPQTVDSKDYSEVLDSEECEETTTSEEEYAEPTISEEEYAEPTISEEEYAESVITETEYPEVSGSDDGTDISLVEKTGDEEFDDDPERIKGERQRNFDMSMAIPFSEVESEDIALQYSNTDNYKHGKYASNYDIFRGIDVSKYQGNIDWKKVKADGVDFAFIRVAYRGWGTAGNMKTDEMYATNITKAGQAGIPVGVYIFSQATTVAEAQAEADLALECIKGYTIQLPVIMDFEYANTGSGKGGRLYDANLTRDEATTICNSFCQRVTDAGYEAMVYANYDMLTNHLNAEQIENKYKIWIARWNNETGYSGEYNYWQFTDRGSVNGISGTLDLDFGYMLIEDDPDTDRNVADVKASLFDESKGVYEGIENGASLAVNPGTEITLASDTANTAIFYTTGINEADTPNPTSENGIRYTEPIKITSQTVIKAIAMKSLFRDSAVTTFAFGVNDMSQNQGDVVDEDMPEGDTQEEKVSKISNYIWTSSIANQTYCGKAIKPSLRVYAGKQLLAEKTDYTVTYKNNVNAGTAIVTITGRGSYTGSCQTTFNIVPRDISESVSAIEPVSVPYNKRNQAPVIALTIDGRKLALNRDYTLSIVKKNDGGEDETVKVCKEPGTYIYTVAAKEKSNYCGNGTVIFNIRDNVTSLSTARITVAPQKYAEWLDFGSNPNADGDDRLIDPTDATRSFELTGVEGGIRPLITVKDKSGNEIPDSEYDISFSNNTGVGNATVTIRAKAGSLSYVGSKSQTFKITGYAINKAVVNYTNPETGVTGDITKALTLTYNGKVQEPLGCSETLENDVPDTFVISFTVKKGEEPLKLKKGRDFTVSYLNNVKAGNATVILTGKGRFSGVLKKTVKIKDYVASEDDNLQNHIFVKFINPDKAENAEDTVNGGFRNVAEYYYIKGGVTPQVKVYYEPEKVVTPLTTEPSDKAIELVSGVDYTLKYSNNKAVGAYNDLNAKNVSIAPVITVTGKKSFKGNVAYTYTILPRDIGQMTISAADKACSNKAGQFAVAPVLNDPYSANKAKLATGVDYERNCIYSLAEANYVRKYDPLYKRSYKRWIAADTVLNPKTDIILDNTAIRVTVTGKGNYTGTNSTVYRMNSLDIAKATIKVSDQNYLGKAVRPGKSDIISITMRVNGVTRTLNPEDYEITGYQKNTGRGTGIMTIHGLGEYCGYKNVNFKINARSIFYVIEFKGNSQSATGAMGNQNVLLKGTKLSTVRFRNPGYEFVGWNTEADGNGTTYANAQELDSIYPGAKMTLYAQWKIINYTIKFENNAPKGESVTGSISPVELSGPQNYTLPKNEISCNGYDLTGWKINGKVYTPGQKISSLAAKDGDVLTAYACWTASREKQVYNAMIAYKSQYPEGTRWTNDNYYGWKGGIYSGGYGCAGFAFMLSDAAFGSAPAYKHTNFNNIRVGDILRVRNGSGGEHSVIVLKIEGDDITVAEGNYNSSVHWGRIITRAELTSIADKRNKGIYVMSRW